MAKKIFVTRQIPEIGIKMLRDKGYEVDVRMKEPIPSQGEIIKALKKKPYDAVLPLLTDKIDAKVFDACPTAKIFANYAVGFDNFNLGDAKSRGITVTNTPVPASTNAVAEHTIALILSLAKKILEGDDFVRAGKYEGFGPMLFIGEDLKNRTLGIIGAGRIGGRVAYHAARGFDMKVSYYDIRRNEEIEKQHGIKFVPSLEEILRISDVISLHVPLLDSTRHMINAERLKMMKPSAFLINTSRGPVVDEIALVEALKNKTIAAAALDVFEFEPKMTRGLTKLKNAVLTPHIASATIEARNQMSATAAKSIIDFFEGRVPENKIN